VQAKPETLKKNIGVGDPDPRKPKITHCNEEGKEL
jgi:hypothetical protein